MWDSVSNIKNIKMDNAKKKEKKKKKNTLEL
jgi:hypothetical protein